MRVGVGGRVGRGHLAWEAPPTGHHPLWEPSHALQAPQKSTRAVPLGRRDGEGGREGRRERGGALGRSLSPSPQSLQSGPGAGGLRLARPLPGTQGLALPRSLGWEQGGDEEGWSHHKSKKEKNKIIK